MINRTQKNFGESFKLYQIWEINLHINTKIHEICLRTTEYIRKHPMCTKLIETPQIVPKYVKWKTVILNHLPIWTIMWKVYQSELKCSKNVKKKNCDIFEMYQNMQKCTKLTKMNWNFVKYIKKMQKMFWNG